MAGQPLAGKRVIELATGLAGPYAGQLLAAYGAEVLKVERPDGGDFARTWGPIVDGESLYFSLVNRAKRSIALDLGSTRAAAVVKRAVAEADVLIENFRPGTLERWGLGPEVLWDINPDLVLCRVSGFGQEGPYRDLPAFDPIIQAMSGFMSINGTADGPPVRTPMPLSDVLTGIHAALAISAALHEPSPRQNNLIDIALLDVLVANMMPQNIVHSAPGMEVRRMGNEHPSLAPYEVYDTSDAPICVAVANDGQWTRFCDAVGLPDLKTDPEYVTNSQRVRNRAQLRRILVERFATRPSGEWVKTLRAHAVPIGPLNSVDQLFEDPHVRSRGLTADVPLWGDSRTLSLPRIPPHNWGSFGVDSAAPPSHGQHTDEVLSELRYSDQDIAALREDGAAA